MADGRKGISNVAGWVVATVLGAAMLYLGVLLVRGSVFSAANDGPVLVTVGFGLLGTAFVSLPLVVAVSQVRAMVRRRG